MPAAGRLGECRDKEMIRLSARAVAVLQTEQSYVIGSGNPVGTKEPALFPF